MTGCDSLAIQKATDNIRAAVGHFREQGRQEALVTREKVVPLQPNVTASPGHSSPKTPASDPLADELARVTDLQRRTRGQ